MKGSDQVIISKGIDYEGQLGFGHGTIIHPDCSIRAESASILFGEFNIIEERVRIINRKPDDNPAPAQMTIGSYNLFEVGCHIEFCEIGSYNVFEHRARVEPNCKIGNGCIITAAVRLPSGSIVPDNTIVYGEGRMMKNQSMPEDQFRMNIKALAEVLVKALQPMAMTPNQK
jgi:dynactin 6